MTDQHAGWIEGLVGPVQVKPGSSVDLAEDFDPGARFGVRKKKDGQELLRQGVKLLAEYQDRLAAQDTYGVLVVLQALDAAGKDSTIRHVLSGVNPAGCHVTSFKAPSGDERDHDFLWRCTRSLPAKGMIGVFNRSYYEEVLIVRVIPAILQGQQLPAAALKEKEAACAALGEVTRKYPRASAGVKAAVDREQKRVKC